MNARSKIVIAALLTGTAVGCAHAPPAPPGPSNGEVRFMGYRLVVQSDERGAPVKAQAFDPLGKAVPTAIVPLGDVSVCAPKPAAEAASPTPGPYCEPFSFLPERISFKTGTHTLCWYYQLGRLIYYPC